MCVFVLGFCAEEGQVRSELPPSIGLCLASCLRGLGNAACGGSLLEYGRDSPVFGCWADLVKCSQDRAVHIGGCDLHSYKPERVKDTSSVPTRLRQNHVEHALCIPGNARTQQCRRPVAEGVPVAGLLPDFCSSWRCPALCSLSFRHVFFCNRPKASSVPIFLLPLATSCSEIPDPGPLIAQTALSLSGRRARPCAGLGMEVA